MYLSEDSIMFMWSVRRFMKQAKSTDGESGELKLRPTSFTSTFVTLGKSVRLLDSVFSPLKEGFEFNF